VRLDPLDVRYARGTLTGRLTAMSTADSGLIAIHEADLVTRDFDLDFPRMLVDTLPFYGWLSGRTIADGSMRALAIEVDWTFREFAGGGPARVTLERQGRDRPAGAGGDALSAV